MNNKIATIVTIISGILVIGSFIWGQDYVKDYINTEVGQTKESIEKNTEQLKINAKYLEKRSDYLKEIRSYYIDRLLAIDSQLVETQGKLQYDSFMISSDYDTSGYEESVKSNKMIIENLLIEKKDLVLSLAKFIDKNPDLLK